jgi:hypothetical protein
MAATSPPRRGVSLHVDSVTLRTRLGAASSAPNHRDKALEAQCARHAQRHASDPTNHDVLYAWGLTLQERAECAEEAAAAAPHTHPQGGTDYSGRTSRHPNAARDAYLNAACEKYAEAVSLHPRFPAALYNHGIALGDLARFAQTADAYAATALWKAACAKYARAVVAAESINVCHSSLPEKRSDGEARSPKTYDGRREANDGSSESTSSSSNENESVRALNNWGLAEQRLAGLATSSLGRLQRLTRAAGRFREALRRDASFDRAAYNLGTVMYALAELAQRRARKLETAASREEIAELEQLEKVVSKNNHVAAGAYVLGASAPAEASACFSAAAMHICLAAAGTLNDASRKAYRASLKLVRHALPRTPNATNSVFTGALRRCVKHAGRGGGEEEEEEEEEETTGGWGPWAPFAADHASFFSFSREEEQAKATQREDLPESHALSETPVPRGTGTDERMRRRFRVRLADIVFVAPASRDASFPSGGDGGDVASGFLTCDATGTMEWFVAPDEPSRDLWVDALSLASDIARRGKSGALERELEERVDEER